MPSGGKRAGAGRPAGNRWKPAGSNLRPRISELRAETVDRMQAIISSDADPLTVVASWVTDPTLDPGFRLSAASCCLPFLYPRLSASQVDARVSVTKIDSADLLRRLDERIANAARTLTIEATPEEPEEPGKSPE